MQAPFRIEPSAPVHAYKTYAVTVPAADPDDVRTASCADVDCPNLEHGWVSVVDEATELGQRQADYIRRHAGRRFLEERTADGLTRFVFEAGQECFARHEVAGERAPIFLVRGGDWRGNPTGERRIHARPEHWVEDMQEQLDEIRTVRERG